MKGGVLPIMRKSKKEKKCNNIILTSCFKDLHTIVFGAATGVVQTLLSAFNHIH